METEQRVWTVPTWAWDRVADKGRRLWKIADRIGCDRVKITVLGTIMQPTDYRFLTDHQRELADCGVLVNRPVEHIQFTVEGDTPVLPGDWRLLATVEHTEVGNFVATSPAGAEMRLAERLQDAAPTCDHCHVNRNRRWTFMVMSGETGEMLRIGRGCLASHLGLHGFPEDALVGWAREMADGDDWLGPVTAAFPSFAVVVAAANAAIREFGWAPTSEDQSTREAVAAWLWAPNRRSLPFTVTPEDAARAEAITGWLAEVDPEGSDFLHNLRTLNRLGLVEPKRLGLAVAAPRAFDRAVANAARDAQRERERAEAQPVPTGKAITVTGTVTKTDVQYNDYGSRRVWTVLADAGWRVWGTIPSGCHAEVGDRVTFTADVEPSDDPTFGFTKRPRKAHTLAKA